MDRNDGRTPLCLSSLAISIASDVENVSISKSASLHSKPLGTLGIIPREIRDKIYEYVLNWDDEGGWDHLDYLGDGSHPFHKNPRGRGRDYLRSGILTASKLIYEEAFPAIFRSNQFHLLATNKNSTSPKDRKYPWEESGDNTLHVLLGTLQNWDRAIPPKHRDKVVLVKRWQATLNDDPVPVTPDDMLSSGMMLYSFIYSLPNLEFLRLRIVHIEIYVFGKNILKDIIEPFLALQNIQEVSLELYTPREDMRKFYLERLAVEFMQAKTYGISRVGLLMRRCDSKLSPERQGAAILLQGVSTIFS